MEYSDYKLIILALTVAVLWIAEGIAPLFGEFVRDLRKRTIHGIRNAVLAVINGVLGVLILGVMIAGSIALADSQGFGLMRLVEWPIWIEAIIAMVLFDIWMYWWHRINHEIPFLWRFHRVHHSDPRMDATTALRFHPGEIILSTVGRVVVLNLIGMELWQLVLYELIATPIIIFHHSNIKLPRRIDDSLRWLIVTPWMHWVHHSHIRNETNSNYSSLLSVWDRVFGSYKFRSDPEEIQFGLDEYPDEEEKQRLAAMLKTPLDRS